MTHQTDYRLSPELVVEITQNGLRAVPEMLRVLLNNLMQAERTKYLHADEYERTAERLGHANGFKPKTIKTRVGEVRLPFPRYGKEVFIRPRWKKDCVTTTLVEMYVMGVSTRKVKDITKQLCGFEISAEQVSRATAQLALLMETSEEWQIGKRYCFAKSVDC